MALRRAGLPEAEGLRGVLVRQQVKARPKVSGRRSVVDVAIEQEQPQLSKIHVSLQLILRQAVPPVLRIRQVQVENPNAGVAPEKVKTNGSATGKNSLHLIHASTGTKPPARMMPPR